MRGNVIFNVDGVLTHIYLDTIQFIQASGSDVNINISGSTAPNQFQYAATDAGSATAIVAQIKALIATGSQSSIPITDVATATISNPDPSSGIGPLLYYDTANNGYYVTFVGTNLGSAMYVDVGTSRYTIAEQSSTNIITNLGDAPPCGSLPITVRDASLRVMVTLPNAINFHSKITSFLPNPFIGGTTDFVVNGIGFASATAGTIYVKDFSGHTDSCPATFVSQYQLSFPHASWVASGSPLVPALFMFYKDSNGNTSNALYVTSVT